MNPLYRVLLIVAVGASALVATGSLASAQDPLPPGTPTPVITTRFDPEAYGGTWVADHYVVTTVFDGANKQWLLDGKPLRESVNRPSFWIHEPRDGKLHTLTLRLPRKDIPGAVYEVNKQIRMPKSLKITAPEQSARISRQRGIAVHVSAHRGYYRLRVMSSKVTGAANVTFKAEYGGQRSLRIKSAQLSQIKPGTRLRVRAQRILRDEILETKYVTVRFR